MNIDLRELLLGDINRLKFVHRFSTGQRVHEESVAEHCYFTALYCTILCEWLEANGNAKGLDQTKILQRALLHDVEEAITGDIPRPFKYRSPELHQKVEEMGLEAAGYVLRAILPLETLVHHWKFAKDLSIDGRVVAFADYLSCLSYMCSERLTGNLSIGTHLEEIRKYGEGFQTERFKFLEPLVTRSLELLEEVLTP